MDQPSRVNAEPIPGYRLIQRLGRGGYGEVWKAEAPGGMHKAIKFVYGDMEGTGDDGLAAEQEFKSLNRVKTIRHPFLLSLERIEIIDGQLLIVMELADRNLWDRFTECVELGLPGIPRAELLGYMDEAAEALDLMNQHYQIQHLDIKPHNIFLVHKHVKVADFGLAKDLEGARGDLTGGITPMYAPPETFEQWISRQSDQYSLAIVYMEMLTGRRPFNGTTTRHLILQHLTAAPDLASLPSPDREAVARALSKKPDERFGSCMEFVRALKGELAVGPVRTPQSVGGIAPPATLDPIALADCNTERVVGPRVKTLPALVTPRSKVWNVGSRSAVRKPNDPVASASTSRRSSLPPERTGMGALVPALIVGLGGTGIDVVRSLRKLILDRFGQVPLPHFRWLCVDTDPSAVDAAIHGQSGVALTPEEVLLTRLQRPTHYLSREGLPPVDSWLPPEALYRIPKTAKTEGTRSIGRLALCDHYHVICHRLRTAIEPLMSTGPIEEADRLTRLGIRSSYPRVYIVSSLTGGTGSGMFLDLAYLCKRELRRLGFNNPHAIGLLGIPRRSNEASNQLRANAHAALTELEHFGSPENPYEALFDTREGPVEDPERAFRRCTLFGVPARPDPEEHVRSASLGAHVLFSDLLCPIGRAVYPDKASSPESPLSVVGIQRVVWPRSQVLRVAAWQLGRQVLADWIEKSPTSVGTVPVEAIENQWVERQLVRTTLREIMNSHLEAALGGHPLDRINHALRPLTDDGKTQSPPPARIRAAFRQLVEIIGRPGPDEREFPFAIGNALAVRVREHAAQADSKLGATILSMVEQPDLRLAGAEEAIRLLRERINDELHLADRKAAAIEEQDRALFIPIRQQLVAPGRDPSFRPANWASSPRDAASLLQRWAGVRLQGLIARANANVYRVLLSNLPEHAHELNLIRGQLTGFLKHFDEVAPSEWTSDGVCQPVFPDGLTSVKEAATRLMRSITTNDLKDYENALQARIRHECRSLAAICCRPRDNGVQFLSLLHEQALYFLDKRADRQGVMQILLEQAPAPDLLRAKFNELLTAATPAAIGEFPAMATHLGLPVGSEPITRLVHDICHDDVIGETVTTDDIVIWRESRCLTINSFPHLARASEHENDDLGPSRSAHSRIDVPWGLGVVG